jgi:hypothetical protein
MKGKGESRRGILPRIRASEGTKERQEEVKE